MRRVPQRSKETVWKVREMKSVQDEYQMTAEERLLPCAMLPNDSLDQ